MSDESWRNTPISLDPDDAVSGGGLLDNITVIWKNPRFAPYGYPDKSGRDTVNPPVPALLVDLVDVETDESYGDQPWKMGNPDSMKPSDDGKMLMPLKAGTGIHDKSRGFQLLQSLKNAQFPKDKLGEVTSNITILENMVCKMVQEPAIGKRMKQKTRPDGTSYDDTVLVISEIVKMPWENDGKKTGAGTSSAASGPPTGGKKGGKKKDGAAAAPPAESPPAADPDAIAAKATSFILELVAESGGSALKKDLPTKAFQKFKADPDRNAIVQMVFDDTWLSAGPWVYDNGAITMG